LIEVSSEHCGHLGISTYGQLLSVARLRQTSGTKEQVGSEGLRLFNDPTRWPLPSTFAIEPDRTALSMATGAEHRSVEVQRESPESVLGASSVRLHQVQITVNRQICIIFLAVAVQALTPHGFVEAFSVTAGAKTTLECAAARFRSAPGICVLLLHESRCFIRFTLVFERDGEISGCGTAPFDPEPRSLSLPSCSKYMEPNEPIERHSLQIGTCERPKRFALPQSGGPKPR
jgi:hypothetical protein